VAARDPIRGDLQEQIMRVIWRLERGAVEDVRQALPPRYRSAYTTVQTVLNRLAERGLLGRQRQGNVIHYSPRVSEADYLAGSLTRALAGASDEARRTALANLVGNLRPGELDEIEELADEISRKRARR
jgi:predicted transcriptional regulator